MIHYPSCGGSVSSRRWKRSTTTRLTTVEVTDFYGRDETLAHLSFACAEMLSARTAGNAKRVAAFAYLLAIHIAEKYTNIASQRPDYRGGLPIARLRKIEDYVRAHLAESISIETLAELAELSPSISRACSSRPRG